MPLFFRKLFAPLAIPGILRVLAGFQALLFVLMMVQGRGRADMFMEKLSLDFGMVLQGEVWRLVSFILLPPADPFSSFGLMFLVFAVFFLFFINDILEEAWGSDGLNAYFYLGYLGSLIAGVLIWLVRPGWAADLALQIPADLATSFLIAAATVAPRLEVRLFFVIPVPLAVIGGLGGLFLLLGTFSMFSLSPILGLAPLLCVANYLIFVLPGLFQSAGRVKETRERRARFEAARKPEAESFHQCESCGATEISHPEREFRVTASGQECCDDCRGRPGTPPGASRS